ncbi:MAG TPA: PA2928 family protein [Ferruginibacter sp.]|nr:PA2928 family protein [Ferruginibacter sp.]HMP20662.1 PA2928 family protein [Ferruginibacter sp.]
MPRYKYFLTAIFTSLHLIPAMQSNAQAKPTIQKTGPAYLVTTNPGTGILYVAQEKNQNSFTCYLQLHDAATATLLKKQLLFSGQEPANHEKIIGSLKNTIWILGDSLVAYDMITLKPVITEAAIIENNTFMANNFASYPNAYLMDEGAQVLFITAANGNAYRLYPANMQLQEDAGINDPAPEEFLYEFAAEYKVNNHYALKYALSNVDTIANKLYILGSDKEVGQVARYYGAAIDAGNPEARRITIMPIDKTANGLDKKQSPVTKKNAYQAGGFLNNKFGATAWHGQQGERIIIHQQKRGSHSKMAVTLIDKEGNETWNIVTGTGPDFFTDYLINDEYLVLFHNASPAIGAGFTSITLKNGKSVLHIYHTISE